MIVNQITHKQTSKLQDLYRPVVVSAQMDFRCVYAVFTLSGLALLASAGLFLFCFFFLSHVTGTSP